MKVLEHFLPCARSVSYLTAVLAVAVGSNAAVAQCGSPKAGDCCAAHLGPGCDNPDCCSLVVALNSNCANSWNITCKNLATFFCEACGGSFGCGSATPSTNPCCTPSGSPYCYDAACCESVCAVDPSCCDAAPGSGGVWHQHCADLAWQHCPDLPGCSPPPLCPGEGDCCASGGNGSPGCSSTSCCNAVCGVDSYCCEVEWDACCVNLAVENCSSLTGCHTPVLPEPKDHPECVGAQGECCIANGSIGCWTPKCCNLICTIDPFCCNVTWDQVCADAAQIYCDACHGGPPPPPPALSCKDNCGGPAAGGCWCDEACCSFGDCCEDKIAFCVGCNDGMGSQPPPAGGCLPSSCGGFGDVCWCDELCFDFGDCCPNVCAACPGLDGCIPPNPADLTGNNTVGVEDLLILLQNWGPCRFERCFVMEDCIADFTHDQQVGVADLLFLLQNWG